MHETDSGQGVQSLRDFYCAVNGADLRAAATEIACHFGLPLEPDTDWLQVEYDFNRLFVGPMAVPAPPYASAYLDRPTLMGTPALEAREVYRALGLKVREQGAAPDDHLAFELDAVLALDALAAAGEAEAGAARELRAWLVAEHMGGWVPKFIEAIRGQQAISGPVAMAATALEQWLGSAAKGAGAGEENFHGRNV